MRTLRASGWVVVAAAIALPAVQIIGRQLTRLALVPVLPESPLDLALLAVAGCALGVVLVKTAGSRPVRPSVVTALTLATLFAVGLAFQLHFGARLQSDGFYYFAYLRSLVFDRDVNFMNDYRMLGLERHQHLFTPTATGYAQSAWTIGPALVWAPFFSAGHAAAVWLNETGRAEPAMDGTSFPYRQAVVIAGLFYTLVGAWCAFRFANRIVNRRTAALATAIVVGGSFMVWYAVAEPTMTHAPSMAGVAAFVWLWFATHKARRPWQWAALGLLAGFIGLIRWQNLIFAALPACDAAFLFWQAVTRRDSDGVGHVFTSGLLFLSAATIGFLPQLVAWKAIYGHYLAVSPIGPEIHLDDPHLVDVLFSARNGLFTMSPVVGVAALGLMAFAWRQPATGIPLLLACACMTYFNASIADWWGSAGFGGRRFDGLVPIAVIGVAYVSDGVRHALRARPHLLPATVLGLAVLWNITYLDAIQRTSQPNHVVDFRSISGEQARSLMTMLAGKPWHPIPSSESPLGSIAALLCAGLAVSASYRLVRSRFAPSVSAFATFSVFAGSFLLTGLGGTPAIRPFVSAAAAAVVLVVWQRQIDRRITFHWIYSGLIGGACVGAVAVLVAIPASWPARLAGFNDMSGAVWSTDGGLVASSAALFLASAGLIGLAATDRRLSLAGLSAAAVVASLTAHASSDARPVLFAALVPAFACGAAALFVALRTRTAAHPLRATALALSPLIVWNLTLVGTARRGEYRPGEPVIFADLARDQAGVLHDWIGHPGSFPANAVFALRNRVSLGDYDALYSGRLFAGASDRTARIDIGGDDEHYVGDGWHGREENDAGTYRWAGREATVIVPLDRAAALDVRVQLDPSEAPGVEPQRLRLVVNGHPLEDRTLPRGDQVVTIHTTQDVWRAGVNRLVLQFAREIRPADRGLGDPRGLAAQIRTIDLVASVQSPQ